MKLTAIVPLATALALTACTESVPVTDLGHSGDALADYAASWDGYAEAYHFPSGSDRIRLVLDSVGQGTLEFGDQPILAPPTDPDVGYPPGMGVNTDVFEWLEGVRYPVHNVTVEGRRLQLALNRLDLYQGWCKMQTPVPRDCAATGYGCLPCGSGLENGVCYVNDPKTNTQVAVDCGKLQLCDMYEVCLCTASACDVQPDSGTELDASLEADGAELVGTLTEVALDPLTVRLNRM